MTGIPPIAVIHSFFAIRYGRPSDIAFILESWQNAHAQTTLGREMGPHYISEQKSVIRRILSLPHTTLRVAVDREDDDAIHGYAVTGREDSNRPLVYYLYVKSESRRLGIATAMVGHLRDRSVVYTHKPKGVPCIHYRGIALADKLPRPESWVFSYYANFAE